MTKVKKKKNYYYYYIKRKEKPSKYFPLIKIKFLKQKLYFKKKKKNRKHLN